MSDPHRDARMSAELRELRRVIEARAPRRRDASIAGLMASARDHYAREQRRLGRAPVSSGDRGAGVLGAWERTVPAELRANAACQGYARGVLRVKASDASARFRLDRWLRAGGLDALISASPAPLTRVVLR